VVLVVVIDSSENPENPQQPDSWPPELYKHRLRSPLPRACGGCGFGEGTFARVSANGEDAPKADIPLAA
jgi:hypothetical protein